MEGARLKPPTVAHGPPGAYFNPSRARQPSASPVGAAGQPCRWDPNLSNPRKGDPVFGRFYRPGPGFDRV